MSVQSSAEAEWTGELHKGAGSMRFGGGAYHGEFTFASRFETGKGTNPEELLAAAHAGCFSMQLSGVLSDAGTPPVRVHTRAEVTIEKGKGITAIALHTKAEVPGISDPDFQAAALKARRICPVSKALAGVPEISLTASLVASLA